MLDISTLNLPDMAFVAPGSLLTRVRGAYGLRGAPIWWYWRARAVLIEATMEALHTANVCFVLRDKTCGENLGMVVHHVGGACFPGEGHAWGQALYHIRAHFTLGKAEYSTCYVLGLAGYPARRGYHRHPTD